MHPIVQTAFAEPANDPGLDVPLTVHLRQQPSANNALVVFVHGLGGSRYGKKATWGKFPGFIFADLPGVDVGMYRYRTLFERLRFTRSVDLEVEARVFADIIRDASYYSRVILIGHSMGGLLCKGAIWHLFQNNARDVLTRIRGLVLMATPQLGSQRLPRFLWNLSWDARALRPHNNLVTSLSEGFVNNFNERVTEDVPARIPLPTYAVLATADHWVDRLSAGLNLPASQIKNVTGSHASIVKPADNTNDSYQFVRTKIEECLKRIVTPLAPVPRTAAPVAQGGGNYRVVAFDLDGTLLRGIEFSWTVVWKYKGFPSEVYKAGMRRYLRGITTYQQWCEWACEQFRAAKLYRKDFADIVKNTTVTKNLHQAILILKKDGFTTAIISGGIDTFLEELIPDADKLFDHIYINKLKFDSDGLISGVETTPYDFEGKAVALEMICKQHGLSTSQAVFVGEGFNDEYVANMAGLAIAYPPTAQGFNRASAFEIPDDDLLKVVEKII
jgi:HAD superfamily phosphoserine phosphatase-like hydrolase